MSDSRYYQEQVAKIENGGLFTRQRCTEITKFFDSYTGNCSNSTMTIRTTFYKPSQLEKC